MSAADMLAKIDRADDREEALSRLLDEVWTEGFYVGVNLPAKATVREVSAAARSGPYSA